MRVKKFIFKFKDYDSKRINVFCIELVCNKKVEWAVQHDPEKKAMWAAKKALYKQKLMEHLKKMVREKMFPGEERFGDYVLCKDCIKKDCKLINMNEENGPNSQVILRETVMYMMKIMKFKRGRKPENWHEIFDYPVNSHHYVFRLKNEGDEMNSIDLEEINHYSYDYNNMMQQKEQMGGKNYESLYRKYKEKYMDLKSRRSY
jgi:hypothetical protein